MTTNLCLIRHGETDWNAQGKIQGRTDIPLNAKGRKQAKETSSFLLNGNFDLIITSPLLRAKETGKIINSALNLTIYTMDEFIERNYGKAEGLTREERAKRYVNGQVPDIESLGNLHKRIKSGLEKIIQCYPNKQVILVAHGGIINAILALLSDSQIGSGKTKLLNACISNLEFKQDQWEIKDYNQTTHLTK